ncbi:cyclin-dependent kinase inhibitor 3 [Elysia marginata]|uniref:protein-tyrosine-phosphatase n=1 Tax=Elysia marginata TaxID=1093978 RepID=A0AAV4H4N1_9GAST|nr:cyclin-dependent kinase inhibitor 3 [Elysia marginata]
MSVLFFIGCRFKDTWRSMSYDIDCLKEMKVEEVFCFCTKGDLYMYRATELLDKYSEAGINCHHYPIDDGLVPEMATLMKLLDEIRVCLMAGKKTLLHCYGGIGRSCAVAACLLMYLDTNLSSDDAKKRLKDLRGDAAIRSVKAAFSKMLGRGVEKSNCHATVSRVSSFQIFLYILRVDTTDITQLFLYILHAHTTDITQLFLSNL